MKHEEDAILCKAHRWLWNEHPETRYLSWHIANERKTTGQQGAILKAKGVLPGVPDYVLNWQGCVYYFEFKASNGKLSESQKNVANALKMQNIAWYEIRTFEEFKKIVELVLSGKTKSDISI